MQGISICLPQEIYALHLKTIGGMKFTPREVDVICCIINGRTSKKSISSFLSIKVRTAETHSRNIRQKLSCSSWENIRDFIEKSGKSSFFRTYYHQLVYLKKIEKLLIEISQVKSENTHSLYILSNFENEEDSLVDLLHKHLNLAGIETAIVKPPFDLERIHQPSRSESHQNVSYILFNISQLNSTDQKGQTISKKKIFLLSDKRNLDNTIQEINEDNSFIDLRNHKNYYTILLEIVNNLIANEELGKLVEEFHVTKEERADLEGFIQDDHKKRIQDNLSSKLKKILILFFCIIISVSMFLFIAMRPSIDGKSIRSNFDIPTEGALLKRSTLINKIDKMLKEQKGIQTVALVGVVGIGGVGKTTMAREFARLQQLPVVWEINAESKNSIINSFKDLAYALAETPNQKEEVNFILRIKSNEEREKQLFSFVKNILKQLSDWLLIYDNVEDIAAIKNCLPRDFSTWGTGKVIITTRNANIKNTSYVNSDYTVSMDELEEKEALTLFAKILYNCEAAKLSPDQKEKISTFLLKIPPFPLDVSTAAYYIKNTQIPYDQYIEQISTYSETFEDVQENLLRETSDYTKTRYGVITLSLKALIEQNSDFKDLLLLIALFDSQNIPKDLLNSFKSDRIANDFLLNLKRFSLITNESRNFNHNVFSVHRSTQAICLAYLLKVLGEEKEKALESVTKFLEDYVNRIIDFDIDVFPLMKLLVSHCEAFLSHKDQLNPAIVKIINIKLGALYVWLNEYEKAEGILESNYKNLDLHDPKNSVEIFQTLMWLGINNAWFGNYEKAKEQLEQSLVYSKDCSSNRYSEIAIAHIELGYTYRHLGNYEKAKEQLEQSVRFIKQYLPENYSFACQALGQLSILFIKMGRYKDAEDVLNQVLEIVNKRFEGNNERFAWCFANMGNIYKELGHYEKARELLEKNIETQKLQMSTDFSNWRIIRLCKDLTSLGDTYKEMGRYKEARELLEQSIEIVNKNKSSLESHPVTASIFKCIGDVYKELGDYKKAQELLESSMSIYEKQHGRNHIDTAGVLNSLGQVYMRSGQYEKAEMTINEALTILNLKKHPKSYKCLESLFELYLMKSKESKTESKELKQEAIKHLKEAHSITKNYFSENSPHVIRIQNKLEQLDVA